MIPMNDSTERIALERIRFAVRQSVNREAIFPQSVSVEEVEGIAEFMGNQLAYHLMADFLAHKGKRQVMNRESVPERWQDALMLSIASRLTWSRIGGWRPIKRFVNHLRRRARTRTIETVVYHYNICPHINIPFGERSRVHFDWMKGADTLDSEPEFHA